jgi:predicted negative regulator of RcsB-dependent stress response
MHIGWMKNWWRENRDWFILGGFLLLSAMAAHRGGIGS